MEEWWKAMHKQTMGGGGDAEKILTILTRIRSVEQKNQVFFIIIISVYIFPIILVTK